MENTVFIDIMQNIYDWSESEMGFMLIALCINFIADRGERGLLRCIILEGIMIALTIFRIVVVIMIMDGSGIIREVLLLILFICATIVLLRILKISQILKQLEERKE